MASGPLVVSAIFPALPQQILSPLYVLWQACHYPRDSIRHRPAQGFGEKEVC